MSSERTSEYIRVHINIVTAVAQLSGWSHLRSADHRLYDKQRTRTLIGSTAFYVASPTVWICLPQSIRTFYQPPFSNIILNLVFLINLISMLNLFDCAVFAYSFLFYILAFLNYVRRRDQCVQLCDVGEISCHDNCSTFNDTDPAHCWGPGPDQCQHR